MVFFLFFVIPPPELVFYLDNLYNESLHSSLIQNF